MKVNIAIERSIVIDLPIASAKRLFDDLETTIGRFPKLKRLSKLAKDQYLWEMQTIGASFAGIAHDVTYGARYQLSGDGNQMSWTPLPGKGNASIAGSMRLVESSNHSTVMHFAVQGELRDVPVPLMYRLAAAPFIQGKFTQLVDGFLERTRDALLSTPAAETAKPARKKAAR